MSKLDIKPFIKKIQPLLNFLKRDSVAIFLCIVAVIFGYLIWKIGNLAGAEPSQDALQQSLLTVVRPKIDPESIKKIQDLQAQNIDIQSYFTDRSNPFQE
jgi:hypothetical protein